MSLIEHKRTEFDEAEEFLSDLTFQMCGGDNLELYLGELVAQGQSQCSNIWSKGIIAYRCRTCQINDSSAICVNCFQGGNHWEHDYVMYHSESGGCCDCGDQAAWKDSGFCTIHQCLRVGDAVVKPELQGITHRVVRYVLEELLAWVVRLSGDANSTEYRNMAVMYLDWLQKVCAVDVLRNLVCKDVVEIHSLQVSGLWDTWLYGITELCENVLYLQNGNSTSLLDMLLEYLPRMPELIIELETTLFLQLLYQNNFKDDFSFSLKDKYENMIISAVHDREYMENYKHLDLNLDRVMVQLFNDPDKTTELIHKYKLLDLFIGVFCKSVIRKEIRNDLVSSSCLSGGEKSLIRWNSGFLRTPAVVNVEHNAIKGKVYLRPQGDLRLIIAHGNIAVDMLIRQSYLFPKFLDVLVKLQWMNPYTLIDAIEFENSWTLAIQLEVVSSCYQDPQFGKETLVKAATYTLKALKLYIKEVASCEIIDNIGKAVSLHIPLHRTLSAILQKLVLLSWDGVKGGFTSVLDFDYTRDEVLQLMEHPLRILVWMAQIRAQVWRKTSEEFSRLELIYRGSFWHDQSMDMDILLLQFCAVAHENMQEHVFIRIAEEFDLKNMVTAPLVVHRTRRQSEIVLLQDFMRLILLIVRERRNLGQIDGDDSPDKCLQYDVIQWLCVRNQTYSQICRALSAISVDHQKLHAMLEKVALYHEPKVADRGYYELKPEYWKEFDPLFPHYYVNELEEAEDRAVKVGKLKHYWRIKAPLLACAPYNRLSDVLHTKACHLFLMNALKEVMHLVKLSHSATIGEALGVTALQIMSVLLSDGHRHLRHGSSKHMLSTELQDAFSTQDIFVNIHVKLQMQSEPPLSIYQMLLQLQKAKNCSRLVDSVDHVLELLSDSTDAKSIALEVSLTSGEALQHRLLKEERQKAILEEFAAKQKAFWDDQDVHGFDDTCTLYNPHMKLSKILEAAYGSTSVSSHGALSKDPVSITEVDCVSEVASAEARECVLCRSKSDTENSSTCWIAFVQQYNLPSLVLGRKENLDEFSENNLFSTSQVPSELGPKQVITVICPPEGEVSRGSCIDYVTAEHVQCCGHQIHFYCFQEHIKTLHSSYDFGYAGKGLLELDRVEFLCPICRRLANVVIPVVDASILSKNYLAQEDVKGGDMIREEWDKFWHLHNNLEKALDFFSSQMLKVRQHFKNHDVATSRFINCKALWEGLALNIVHCEVETREGYRKVNCSSGTSSSAPTNFLGENNWSGDSAHWIALQELGKLAMLSNTLPGTAQEKGRMLGILRQSLGLLDRREGFQMSETPSFDNLIELEKILQEMFPFNPLNTDQHPVSLAAAEVSLEGKQYVDENNVEKNTVSHCLHCEEPVEELEDIVVCDALSRVPIAKRKQRCLGDFKAEELETNVPVSCVVQEQKQEIETTCYLNPVTSIKLSSAKTAVISENHETCNWPLDILRNGVLAADPFGLLIVFFIIFKGQPQLKAILLMVKFAYTVAVLQIQKAVGKYRCRDAVCEKDVVQRACLPFLRRATLLVQLTSQLDSRLGVVKNGTKVMDSVYLQQALQLPDCTEIMRPQNYGLRVSLATALQSLQNPICAGYAPGLYTVPQKVLLHKLPRVFQELLLENLQNKRTCVSCNEMPPNPAICLLCGALLCCGSDCCKVEGVGECSRHAAEESAGVGIFLLLRSTQLLLLRNNRSCMGLALYLDTHGEEDLYLQRSQLLYLSNLRLNEVRRLWLTAAFDYDSHILHNSQSRPCFY